MFSSLPVYSQHLLVLLFGTFRVIHSNCEAAQTGMTAEALGVSVAPSFFHTCVAAGKTAKMEDVQRFKVGGRVWLNLGGSFPQVHRSANLCWEQYLNDVHDRREMVPQKPETVTV